MKVLGLTGSIAVGKTHISNLFKKHDIEVFSADDEVRRLQKTEEVILKILSAFPEVKTEKGFNKQLLSDLVFQNKERLLVLEGILHPFVKNSCRIFLKSCLSKNKKGALIEVPLLFESNYYQKLCDVVITVVAPANLQKARALKRSGMTLSKLDSILQQQLSENEKIERSDYVIKNDQKTNIESQVSAVLMKEGLL